MADYAFSFSLTTFSPSGKLGQIEHAFGAVKNGFTSLAIKASNGVVLCAEKKAPQLVDPDSQHRISVIDSHVGVTYSGRFPDSVVIVKAIRKAAAQYRIVYGQPIPIRLLTIRLADLMQEYTQARGVRPFGVSILIAGHDYLGHHLYQVDPSGSYYAWKATAMGKASQDARTFLEKRYSPDMETEDAIHTALLTLKESFDGRMQTSNVEVGVVTPEGLFKVLSSAETKDYLDEVV